MLNFLEKDIFLDEYYKLYNDSNSNDRNGPNPGLEYLSWGTKLVKIDDEWGSNDFWSSDYHNVANLLRDRSVLFIDIGANEGQTARKAYRYFSDCQVISYEPLKSCNCKLDRIIQSHPGFVFHNCALGAEEGSTLINEYEQNTGLSSVLSLCGEYDYDGGVSPEQVKKREVKVCTLSSLMSEWKKYQKDVNVLKKDTQGTELDILRAGTEYDFIWVHKRLKDKIREGIHGQ